ncbi:MAG TPA: DUF4389 domain-containing protein [Spirochaetota bacterium]|nr:DUF4389 domain-containing protein [Spirochaetota bacterium]
MRLVIKHQEKYSRGELLLRTFFGWLYIYIPHYFVLFFVSIWGAILQFVAFWVILFTGRYPQSMFEYQVGLLKWTVRLSARAYNVSDGYPSFGINGTDEYTDLNVPYPEKVDRGLVLLRFFLGLFYVIIPHYFILGFRGIWVGILAFVAWWVVLFTGRYPEDMHNWVVGQVRWQTRVMLYMQYMTDTYPAFTGDELPEEKVEPTNVEPNV